MPGSTPRNAFVRYNARILDPTTAGKIGNITPYPTAYVSDRLLVTLASSTHSDVVFAAIDRAAEASGLQRREPWNPFDDFNEGVPDSVPAEAVEGHLRQLAVHRRAFAVGAPVVLRVPFVSASTDAAPPPVDVWDVLRRLRAGDEHYGRLDVAEGRESASTPQFTEVVGLDHLMFAAAFIQGTTAHPIANALVWGDTAHPIANGGVGNLSSEQSGWVGRAPVAVTVSAPRPPQPRVGAPHVVTLDTGVGEHPWFRTPNEVVHADLTLTDGTHVGLDVTAPDNQASNPEGDGAVPDEMTGTLASYAGHGTFISGLLRQSCPSAVLSTLRVMGADGVVPESELSDALRQLAIRQTEGGGPGEPGRADVLVLSLGYYAELDDELFTAGLEAQLIHLASGGTRIYVAAGNDCTERRSYPAGFADHAEFLRNGESLRSVRALNPGGEVVALFSNDGGWVNDQAVGANVVSTLPKFPAASYQPVMSGTGPGGRKRATIDPDDYSSGFGLWSGTSFAAPLAAGQYLQQHLADYAPHPPQGSE